MSQNTLRKRVLMTLIDVDKMQRVNLLLQLHLMGISVDNAFHVN
jgi:hypothetical protein